MTTLTITVEIVGEVMRDNNLTQFFVFVICAEIIFSKSNFLTGSFCTKIKHNETVNLTKKKNQKQKFSFFLNGR